MEFRLKGYEVLRFEFLANSVSIHPFPCLSSWVPEEEQAIGAAAGDAVAAAAGGGAAASCPCPCACPCPGDEIYVPRLINHLGLSFRLDRC